MNMPDRQLVMQTKYWSYVPGLISSPDKVFDDMLPQLEKVCKSITLSMYGKSFPSRRVSCLYSESVEKVAARADAKNRGFDYKDTPAYMWSSAPKSLLQIRDLVEEFFEIKTDYVLCHIYRGLPDNKKPGSDNIGWHNDKEALDSDVVSISLGATRKFQFRHINDKEICDELELNSGDVVHMHGPREGQLCCQRKYKHRVPEMGLKDLIQHIKSRGIEVPEGRKTYETIGEIIRENNIPPSRINLTFRQYED
jgi:hypothetical protein